MTTTYDTLRDSDTNDELTCEQLGITEEEYERLCGESEGLSGEGHVRTSTGRRVYATEY